MGDARFSEDELMKVLGDRVDAEEALVAIRQSMAACAVPANMTREQALQVLEHVAQRSDVIGIAARFGKARLFFA